ncbi:MAG: OmpA family protein [Porticoccaceae bacterium]|nr:OmpA family protein [Porticoccaceae bacterium]
MKTISQFLAVLAITTTTLISSSAFAGEPVTEIKQGVAFSGGAMAGLAAAGPVGFLLGALGGYYLGEEFEKADALPATELALSESKAELVALNSALRNRDSQVVYLESELDSLVAANEATRLEFQLMFRTGEDDLQEEDQTRIDMLADYLQRNPHLNVRLDGHADPRGSDEYNNVLAKFRALSVANALYLKGIEQERIRVYYHGAAESEASLGDYEAYARDRRVNVEVFQRTGSEVAQSH